MGELVHVDCGERIELVRSGLGERDPHDALIVWVDGALDQPSVDGAVDQSDRAVVTQDEVAGDLADGRACRVGVTLDRQHELVFGGGQSGRSSLVFLQRRKRRKRVRSSSRCSKSD